MSLMNLEPDVIPGLPDSLLIQGGAGLLKALALGQLIISVKLNPQYSILHLYWVVCGHVSIMQEAVSASLRLLAS